MEHGKENLKEKNEVLKQNLPAESKKKDTADNSPHENASHGKIKSLIESQKFHSFPSHLLDQKNSYKRGIKRHHRTGRRHRHTHRNDIHKDKKLYIKSEELSEELVSSSSPICLDKIPFCRIYAYDNSDAILREYQFDYVGEPKNDLYMRSNTTQVPDYWLYTDIVHTGNNEFYKLVPDKNSKYKLYSSLKKISNFNRRTVPHDKRLFKNSRYASDVILIPETDSTNIEIDAFLGENFISIINSDNNLNFQTGNKKLSSEEQFLKNVSEINNKLYKDFSVVELWMSLVQEQKRFFKTFKNNKSEGGIRAFNEKCLSIYEKALKHNPSNTLLILNYLQCQEEINENTQVINEWNKFLQKFPENLELWFNYLKFRQRNGQSFTVSTYTFEYQRSVKAYFASYDETVSAYSERFMVLIFQQLCRVLYESGYTEKAIGLYQSMLEINLFCPIAYENVPFDKKLEMFEDFWDNNIPKIGENNAKGWLNSLFDDCSSNTYPPKMFSSEFESELILETTQWLPFRTSIENDETVDLNRYVLLDDISACIFQICHFNSKKFLINSFLNLLSFPFNNGLSSNTTLQLDAISTLDLYSPPMTEVLLNIPTTPDEAGHSFSEPENSFNEPEHSFNFFHNKKDSLFKSPIHISLPFSTAPQTYINVSNRTPDWPGLLHIKPIYAQDSCNPLHNFHNEKLNFARNVLLKCQEVLNDQCFLSTSMQYESMFNQKNIDQFSKALLQKNPSKFFVWNTYALINFRQGKYEEATRICTTIINRRIKSIDIKHLACFYRTLIDIYMHLDGPKIAQSIAVCLAEKTEVVIPFKEEKFIRNTQIIRAKKSLKNKINDIIATNLCNSPDDVDFNLIDYIRALSVLELFDTNDVTQAIRVYQEVVSSIGKKKLPTDKQTLPTDKQTLPKRNFPTEELIYDDFFLLLYQNMKKSVIYQHAYLRESLDEMLEKYPTNTLALSLYSWNERKFKVYNRLNKMIETLADRHQEPVIRFFSVWNELTNEKKMPNISIVKHQLDQLISNERTSHCPSIWATYIQLELSQNNADSAKNLFYRAIRSCPWSKYLYMYAFRALKNMLDENELFKVKTLLKQKELRIRTNSLID